MNRKQQQDLIPNFNPSSDSLPNFNPPTPVNPVTGMPVFGQGPMARSPTPSPDLSGQLDRALRKIAQPFPRSWGIKSRSR